MALLGRRARSPKRAALIVVALVGAAGFAACTLNPQPLPPSDGFEEATGGADASTRYEGGSFETPSSDAGTAGDPEGGRDGGDASDAGDAGDAGGDGGDGGDDGDAAADAG